MFKTGLFSDAIFDKFKLGFSVYEDIEKLYDKTKEDKYLDIIHDLNMFELINTKYYKYQKIMKDISADCIFKMTRDEFNGITTYDNRYRHCSYHINNCRDHVNYYLIKCSDESNKKVIIKFIKLMKEYHILKRKILLALYKL